MKQEVKFPSRAIKPRLDYSKMDKKEQIKRVSISIANWQCNPNVSLVGLNKLRGIRPERLVDLFNQLDGWPLYANRHIGVPEKVRQIVEIYDLVVNQ